MSATGLDPHPDGEWSRFKELTDMTVRHQQQIVDLVMSRMALRHGSSTRRDFEVACLTVEAIDKDGE
jgi:hypothetical protein